MIRPRPWDIVRTPKGAIAIVTETNGTRSSITFCPNQDETGEKNAWWDQGPQGEGASDQLHVLGSAIVLLVNATAHPFGDNTEQGEHLFKRRKS
jgi:hypothetical protein